MKIVFMGTPDFAVPILKALDEKYEVLLVISQPNRVKKKGIFLDTPVAKEAKKRNLFLRQPEKVKELYEEIKQMNPDVLVSAAYGQYVPSTILNLFKKTLNVHGSLLPKYRGGAPIQRAIRNGDTKTGVTIIEMAKRLDSGVMYGKTECEITDKDTSSMVFERLSYLGRDLLLEVIEDVYNGKNLGIAQIEQEATYAPNIEPEEEILNFNKPSKEVLRQIHSLTLEPGATIFFHGMRIKIYEARVVLDSSRNCPGTILSLNKKLLVKTLDGAIEIEEILIPGKKKMKVKDFLNGQKIFKEYDVISC